MPSSLREAAPEQEGGATGRPAGDAAETASSPEPSPVRLGPHFDDRDCLPGPVLLSGSDDEDGAQATTLVDENCADPRARSLNPPVPQLVVVDRDGQEWP